MCVLFRCTLTSRMLWAGRGFTQCTAAVSMGSKTWQPYRTYTTGPFYTTCSSATHRRAYMWANTQQNHPHTQYSIVCYSLSMHFYKWVCVCMSVWMFQLCWKTQLSRLQCCCAGGWMAFFSLMCQSKIYLLNCMPLSLSLFLYSASLSLSSQQCTVFFFGAGSTVLGVYVCALSGCDLCQKQLVQFQISRLTLRNRVNMLLLTFRTTSPL